MLRCADGTYYTGDADDLERRVAQHQLGDVPGYTYDRRPVELMVAETFQTRKEALSRELQVKDWSKKKKEALFRGDWGSVSRAAASRPRVSTSRHAGSQRTEGDKDAIRFEPVQNRR